MSGRSRECGVALSAERHAACGDPGWCACPCHGAAVSVDGAYRRGQRPDTEGRHDPVALGGGYVECSRCGAGWDERDDEARGRPRWCEPNRPRIGDGEPAGVRA